MRLKQTRVQQTEREAGRAYTRWAAVLRVAADMAGQIEGWHGGQDRGCREMRLVGGRARAGGARGRGDEGDEPGRRTGGGLDSLYKSDWQRARCRVRQRAKSPRGRSWSSGMRVGEGPVVACRDLATRGGDGCEPADDPATAPLLRQAWLRRASATAHRWVGALKGERGGGRLDKERTEGDHVN